jgi:hypothetical protein
MMHLSGVVAPCDLGRVHNFVIWGNSVRTAKRSKKCHRPLRQLRPSGAAPSPENVEPVRLCHQARHCPTCRALAYEHSDAGKRSRELVRGSAQYVRISSPTDLYIPIGFPPKSAKMGEPRQIVMRAGGFIRRREANFRGSCRHSSRLES